MIFQYLFYIISPKLNFFTLGGKMKALLVIFGLLFSASLFATDGNCDPEKEDCETTQLVFSGDTGEDCEGDDCEKSE